MTDELSVDSAPIRPVREERLLNSSGWWRPIETAPHNARAGFRLFTSLNTVARLNIVNT